MVDLYFQEEVVSDKKCSCNVLSKTLAFEQYCMLNALWRLTFRKGTCFSLPLQELLDSFQRVTPEYKTSPMTIKHLKSTLKDLDSLKFIHADIDDNKVTLVLFCIPFVRTNP